MLNQVEIESIGFFASTKIASALAKMTGKHVKALNVKTEEKPLAEIQDEIKNSRTDEQVLAYTQMLAGISGMSILVLSGRDAATLSDILNGRESGTTTVLSDIDKSAIKETLNILGNTYTNVVGNSLKVQLVSSIPFLSISDSEYEVFEKNFSSVTGSETNKIIHFTNELTIEDEKIKLNFYALLLTNN